MKPSSAHTLHHRGLEGSALQDLVTQQEVWQDDNIVWPSVSQRSNKHLHLQRLKMQTDKRERDTGNF